jgi:hypothetical protein
MFLLRVLVLVGVLLSSTTLAISCLDGSGAAVDWFAAIKLPDSYAYYYTTGGALQVGATRQRLVSDSEQFGGLLNTSTPTGPLGKTFLSLYKASRYASRRRKCSLSSSTSGHAFYNDQSSGQQHTSNGHTKVCCSVFCVEQSLGGPQLRLSVRLLARP